MTLKRLLAERQKELKELLNDYDPDEIYVCEECGSSNIETTYGCNCTTGKARTINENDTVYCDNCDETTMITLEEFRKVNP